MGAASKKRPAVTGSDSEDGGSGGAAGNSGSDSEDGSGGKKGAGANRTKKGSARAALVEPAARRAALQELAKRRMQAQQRVGGSGRAAAVTAVTGAVTEPDVELEDEDVGVTAVTKAAVTAARATPEQQGGGAGKRRRLLQAAAVTAVTGQGRPSGKENMDLEDDIAPAKPVTAAVIDRAQADTAMEDLEDF